MLFIRRQPTETFEDALLDRFVTEMTDHAMTAHPVLCWLNGAPQVSSVVRRAVERAKTCGFNNQGPVRLFIEMAFVFGSEFHDDPQYAWAAQILSDCTQETQAVCAERLYERFIDYRDQVTDEGLLADPMIWKGLSHPMHWPQEPTDEHFVAQVLDYMERLHRQKFRYQGRGDLVNLIGEAKHKASDLGFTTAGEYALIGMLMFVFGHGCLDDPIYPGFSAVLRDVPPGSREGCAGMLEDHASELLTALHAPSEEHRP